MNNIIAPTAGMCANPEQPEPFDHAACLYAWVDLIEGGKWFDHPLCAFGPFHTLVDTIGGGANEAIRPRFTPYLPRLLGAPHLIERKADHRLGVLISRKAAERLRPLVDARWTEDVDQILASVDAWIKNPRRNKINAAASLAEDLEHRTKQAISTDVGMENEDGVIVEHEAASAIIHLVKSHRSPEYILAHTVCLLQDPNEPFALLEDAIALYDEFTGRTSYPDIPEFHLANVTKRLADPDGDWTYVWDPFLGFIGAGGEVDVDAPSPEPRR